MNELIRIEEEVAPQLLPCVVLSNLQRDFSTAVKPKNVPFSRVYNFSSACQIEMSIELNEGQYHLKVKSVGTEDEFKDPNFKRVSGLVNTYTCKALASTLNRLKISPCSSMPHLGVDEILALFECIDSFRSDMTLPFIYRTSGPRGEYELVSVREKSGHCEIVIETNYIHGNKMKWTAELEFVHQALERADKIVLGILADWLNAGATRRMDFRQESQVAR